MENKHIIQAFQEALADLPPEEQALKVLQFTERMQELEAADLARSAHSAVPHGPEVHVGAETRKGSDGARSGGRSGSNLPPGWEGFGEQEADKEYDEARSGRRSGGARLQTDTSKKNNLPVLIGICAVALCLIVAIIVAVIILRDRDGKQVEPNDPNEFESGYVESAGAEGKNTDSSETDSAPGDDGEASQEPEDTPGGTEPGQETETAPVGGSETNQETETAPVGGTEPGQETETAPVGNIETD